MNTTNCEQRKCKDCGGSAIREFLNTEHGKKEEKQKKKEEKEGKEKREKRRRREGEDGREAREEE